jgi:aerobic carbon-monoxide dehydrogenase medium subunit
MIPAAFEYVRAGSVDEAVSLLGQHGDDAKLLAGGHSLLPLMKLRLATPSVLVDIGRLKDLSYVRDAGDHIAIGALTRHRDLEVSPVLAAGNALVAEVAGQIGDPQVRHRGTIGGSIAHGDPASDLPTALVALDASLVLTGKGGTTRTVAATEFFKGFLETALGAEELLTEIRVPKAGAGTYVKFNRRAQDWAIVGAIAVKVNGSTRVALTNMGSVPVRARAVEAALAGGASATDAAASAADGTEPPSDLNASPEYRQHLARVLTRRALEAIA